MALDSKTPNSITMARLLNSPPADVYAELKEASPNREDVFFRRDPKIEEALLARNDPLITLGLAQFCSSKAVATVLYKRGQATTGDAAYNKALRMGVLSNPILPRQIMSQHTFGVVPDEDVLYFINTEKDDQKNDETDELYAIVTNPGAKRLLDKLYNVKKPFDTIPDEKYVRAIYWSHTNPALREDESSVHGPDMDAWGIHNGILRLMETLPLTENGLRTAYYILKSADPHGIGICKGHPAPLFQRWQSLQVPEDFDKYSEGDAPGLNLKEEFLCMLASAYGWYSMETPDKKSKIEYIGSADSPDLLLRCAYYAHERKLTPEQMEKGHDRDGDGFTIAALWNDTIFWDAKTRASLEGFIRGNMIHRYKRRCEEIKKKHPEFDMKPVSEEGASLLEDEAVQPTEDQKRLERLESMVAAGAKQLQSVYKMLTWILILMIVAVVLIWRPHF
jgi:hypothetical protein